MPAKPKEKLKECDLYPALKKYLEKAGYVVKGEVQDCDVVAVKDGEAPVVVELKLALNLKVLMQAVNRLTYTPRVYVGVCNRCVVLSRDRVRVNRLFRTLGIGLISINPKGKGAVQVLLEPEDYRPRTQKRSTVKLVTEFEKLSGDPNAGGSGRRRGIMTVYRQRALAIADFLEQNGESKASVVAKAVEDPKARAVLYTNVYGWFERGDKGIYRLTEKGRTDLRAWTGDGSPV